VQHVVIVDSTEGVTATYSWCWS